MWWNHQVKPSSTIPYLDMGSIRKDGEGIKSVFLLYSGSISGFKKIAKHFLFRYTITG